ncbi:B12-binding domain-containing radical SAM protein [Chloroflexota bacterium]
MRIALVKPPVTYADWNRRPILGICYISAALKTQGISCKIFDAHYNVWTYDELIQKILEYEPTLVGFTAMTHEVIPCSNIANVIKKRLGVTTVIGGCHVTPIPERTLNEFGVFDYAVIGEGEKTIIDLVQFIQKNRANTYPVSISGLAFRDSNNNVIVNDPRTSSTSSDLDLLPFPDFTEYYTESDSLAGKGAEYPMMSSRGCPYNCAFCMRVLGKKVRRRSAQNIVDEMEYASTRWGAHTFKFVDEILLFNDDDTRELLNLMINTSLPDRIRWNCTTRANLVNKELIDLSKKAGCYRIEIGVESGNENILKAINKGITIQQIRGAIRIIKEAGMATSTNFILGHPNETKETIRDTIKLAAELNTDDVGVGIMVPYPGTRIYDMALKGEAGYRLLTENWSEYDKYGGQALELRQLTAADLGRWQRYFFIYFYLRNFRFIDFIKFILTYRRGIKFILKKILFKSYKQK